jgi:prepilin-type N-terminal cleavage/methylation domain-containing protein
MVRSAMTPCPSTFAPLGTGRTVLSGFTLIEMLVALLILAIMSALGYSTYRSARIAAERAELNP